MTCFIMGISKIPRLKSTPSLSLRLKSPGQICAEHHRSNHQPEDLILDIGCGMGGLSNLISQKGFKVEALTPNKNQIRHIRSKYPTITCYQKRFQEFDTDKKYGTIINSESLQYIPLEKAFEKAESIVKPDGTWIIADYFKFNNSGVNKSSHLLDDFVRKSKEHGWEITYQQDITPHILPTLKFVYNYAERFLLPLVQFTSGKSSVKRHGYTTSSEI